MRRIDDGIHQFRSSIFRFKQGLFDLLAGGQHRLALRCPSSQPALKRQRSPTQRSSTLSHILTTVIASLG